MKIKKFNTKPLTEDVDGVINAEEYVEENNLENAPEIINLDNASKEEIKDTIVKSVAENSEDDGEYEYIDEDELNADVLAAYRFSGQIDSPVGTGTEKGLTGALWRGYRTRMLEYRRFLNDLKDAKNTPGAEGITKFGKLCKTSYKASARGSGGYPDIIVFGMPGFGKTAQIEAFAAEHHIRLAKFSLNGITSDVFQGIPYPVKGSIGMEQAVLPHPDWAEIVNNPDVPYILFFDEVNRGDTQLQSLALDVVNNHRIKLTKPERMAIVRQTGQKVRIPAETADFYMNNILFSVYALNPGSLIYTGTGDVESALLGRVMQGFEIEGNKAEFRKYINRVYDRIFKEYGDQLPPDEYTMYDGQQKIFNHLLKSPKFKFTDEDEMKEISDHNQKVSTIGLNASSRGSYRGFANNLSYRTLTALVTSTDGTKKDFMAAIARDSKGGSLLTPSTVEMLGYIMDDYYDTPPKGLPKNAEEPIDKNATSNEIFKASKNASELLDDLLNNLD